MLQNLKLILVAIACFFIGGISFFAWSDFSQTQQQNDELLSQLQMTNNEDISESSENRLAQPTNEATDIQSPTSNTNSDTQNIVAQENKKQTGSISGSLGYPSSGIPPLVVYAFAKDTYATFFKVETKTNQQSFTIDSVKPGTYVVVAYPQDMPGLAGGYTKAVACGLSVECTDHSLVSITVEAGKTTPAVEVKDWYAPEGTFPKRP